MNSQTQILSPDSSQMVCESKQGCLKEASATDLLACVSLVACNQFQPIGNKNKTCCFENKSGVMERLSKIHAFDRCINLLYFYALVWVFFICLDVMARWNKNGLGSTLL